MRRTIHKLQVFSLIALLMLPLFVHETTPDTVPESITNTSDAPADHALTSAPSRITSATSSYIVQASSAVAAKSFVIDVGGRITATLNIIHAVGAELNDAQVEWLRSQPERIRVYDDDTLNVTGSGSVAETYYPTLIGAAKLHKKKDITGKGITIAVLDTGLWKSKSTEYNALGKKRILAQYDATVRQRDGHDDDHHDDNDDRGIDDWNGHGTHVTSIIMSSARTKKGNYQGVAPNANVVAVRAFEPDGSGSYLNVIKALDWIVSHKKKFDIRILNLSFGASPASHYWDDPVNQAVMAVWKKGIVVVNPNPLWLRA